MKVIAYTALHYGAEYLAYAIKSVIDHVDEYYVLYSASGSHGYRTNERPPDTRETLYAIAQSVAGGKLRWIDGEWPYEGAQRDSIHQYAPDADVIIVLDSDEIWSEGLAWSLIDMLKKDNNHIIRNWRVPIIHYWRSFHRCVIHDPAFPVRMINCRAQSGEAVYDADGHDEDIKGFLDYGGADYNKNFHSRINHMGYAQRSATVKYKLLTHGHRGEFRRDVDWFNDVFMANRQTDCHPVGSEYWNPKMVNPMDYMPDFMKHHPNFKLEVIP